MGVGVCVGVGVGVVVSVCLPSQLLGTAAAGRRVPIVICVLVSKQSSGSTVALHLS